MTYRPALGILSASIVLALAGAVHAQAPAAPSTTPAPPAPAAAPATTPAPAATPKSGTSTSKSSQGGTSKRGTSPSGKAPTGTPGVAAVPGTSSSGSAKAGKDRSKEAHAKSEGLETRQLQTAYADLMTPEEMAAHKKKVKQTKTYAECKTLFDATGKDMEARAKAQNKTVKATSTEICDKAKERGRITG
jgi:hypothetical protein